MKKLQRILTLALILSFGLLFVARADDQGQLLIDSARNAALKFKINDTAKVDGNFDVSGDFVKGLNTVKANFKFPAETQKEIGDALGSLFLTLGDTTEVVGNLDMTVPENKKADMPKKLQGNAEWVLSESKAYAKGVLALEAPTPEKVPKISVDGKVAGDGKNVDGAVNYDVNIGEPDAKNAPFKTFQVDISEKEQSTTIVLSIAVLPTSPMAQQLKAMGKSPDMVTQGIKQQLAQMKIQCEKAEVSEVKDAPDVSAKLTIVVKDWRGTVTQMMAGSMAQAGAQQKIDVKKMQTSVAKMLEAKFDMISVKVNVEGPSVKGSVSGKVSNVQAFLVGYYDVVGMMLEAKMADEAAGGDMSQKLAMAYQSVAMEEARKALELWGDSGASYKGDGKLLVEGVPGEKDKPGSVKADGNFNVNFDGFKGYITKAQAAGYPIGKNTAGKMEVTMNDAGKVAGKLFAYSDAKVAAYYKQLIGATLSKAKMPEEVVKIVEGIELKGAAASVAFSKDGADVTGYSETSDLTPAITAVLKQAAPEFSGNAAGMSITGKMGAGKVTGEGSILFTKLMEGKSTADLQKAFGSVAINDKAKPEDVKMVAVTKPEVKIPANLVAVETDGMKLLDTGIMAAVTGAAGGADSGGGKNMMLILGGVVGLGVLGAGLMAGKKKD